MKANAPRRLIRAFGLCDRLPIRAFGILLMVTHVCGSDDTDDEDGSRAQHSIPPISGECDLTSAESLCQSCSAGEVAAPEVSYCVNTSVCQDFTIVSMADAVMQDGGALGVRYVSCALRMFCARSVH
jgi:hypothetical protein